MKKNNPVNIQDAYFKIVSNDCTNFQKNPSTDFLELTWKNHVHGWGQTDRQTVEFMK